MLSTPHQRQLLISLFEGGKLASYTKGEYIIRPGETPQGVYYITEGLVKSYDITKYGEENLLIIRKQGEILGLTWAVTGDKREIIYTALAPTKIRMVSRETFLDFIHANTEIALPVLEMVTDMYRWHSQHIIGLEYRSVRERLIAFLLMMADRFGELQDTETLINVPLRHQDIASSINSSRETASRELAILHRKGLIDNDQSLIVLKDIPSLKKYL